MASHLSCALFGEILNSSLSVICVILWTVSTGQWTQYILCAVCAISYFLRFTILCQEICFCAWRKIGPINCVCGETWQISGLQPYLALIFQLKTPCSPISRLPDCSTTWLSFVAEQIFNYFYLENLYYCGNCKSLLLWKSLSTSLIVSNSKKTFSQLLQIAGPRKTFNTIANLNLLDRLWYDISTCASIWKFGHKGYTEEKSPPSGSFQCGLWCSLPDLPFHTTCICQL